MTHWEFWTLAFRHPEYDHLSWPDKVTRYLKKCLYKEPWMFFSWVGFVGVNVGWYLSWKPYKRPSLGGFAGHVTGQPLAAPMEPYVDYWDRFAPVASPQLRFLDAVREFNEKNQNPNETPDVSDAATNATAGHS